MNLHAQDRERQRRAAGHRITKSVPQASNPVPAGRDKGCHLKRPRGQTAMPVDLNALIAANDEVAERLSWIFDFRLDLEAHQTDWFTIDGFDTYQHIGHEGAGGAFVQLPDQRILYISSEGQAGVIAADFNAFMQLIVMHPYWQDLLKFSGGGKLAEMRRAAIALEAMTADEEEDLEEARESIKSELSLKEPVDAIAALHRAVSTSNVIVRSSFDGNPAQSLFNTFTADGSPSLRGYLE
jgi:hypothetical protein